MSNGLLRMTPVTPPADACVSSTTVRAKVPESSGDATRSEPTCGAPGGSFGLSANGTVHTEHRAEFGLVRLARCHRRRQPTCTHCCEPVHAQTATSGADDSKQKRHAAPAASSAAVADRTARSSSAAAASPTAPAGIVRSRDTSHRW